MSFEGAIGGDQLQPECRQRRAATAPAADAHLGHRLLKRRVEILEQQPRTPVAHLQPAGRFGQRLHVDRCEPRVQGAEGVRQHQDHLAPAGGGEAAQDPAVDLPQGGRIPLLHVGLDGGQEGGHRDAPRNTIDAIETGCRHAQAGAVERMYRVFRELELNPLCIVSGGAGRPLVDQISMPRRYVENLVLDGLARIALTESAPVK